jgi:quercetin dioxygenase-like cupin family protein
MNDVLSRMRRSDRIGAARGAAGAPQVQRRHCENHLAVAARPRSPRQTPEGLTMALHHCQSGEVARLGVIDDLATVTAALARTPSFEAIHLVVRAGQSIARHHVAGSMTLYCIAGHMRLSGDAPAELQAGDWLFLDPGTPHSVEAVADSSLLLTILFDEGGGVAG